jgi:hypothetical protein
MNPIVDFRKSSEVFDECSKTYKKNILTIIK